MQLTAVLPAHETGGHGIEPQSTDLEFVVLPLNYPPKTQRPHQIRESDGASGEGQNTALPVYVLLNAIRMESIPARKFDCGLNCGNRTHLISGPSRAINQ